MTLQIRNENLYSRFFFLNRYVNIRYIVPTIEEIWFDGTDILQICGIHYNDTNIRDYIKRHVFQQDQINLCCSFKSIRSTTIQGNNTKLYINYNGIKNILNYLQSNLINFFKSVINIIENDFLCVRRSSSNQRKTNRFNRRYNIYCYGTTPRTDNLNSKFIKFDNLQRIHETFLDKCESLGSSSALMTSSSSSSSSRMTMRIRAGLNVKITTITTINNFDDGDDNMESITNTNLENLCKICFSEKSVILLIPCHHCSTCIECTKKIVNRLCPICRTPIKKKIKIFFG